MHIMSDMLEHSLWKAGPQRRLCLVLSAFAAFVALATITPNLGQAQVTTAITSDGTLGTIVTPSGSVHTITGGTRPGGGANLFHSFGLFNVGAGDTANFFNDSGLSTSNILSRVTGGNPSNIFGTIQTTSFGSANLFLINPAGVVFGPTASLNVGGAFHVSTADYVRLTDGTRFNAVPGPQDAVLTSAPPEAFGFLDPNPAAIAIQGSTLQVGEGQTLSVVGGPRTFMTDEGETVPSGVSMTGGLLSAPSGQVKLASVGSPGEILLSGLQPAPNVNGSSFTAMGAIGLSQEATLDVSGAPGGTVLIRGGQFVVDRSTIKNVNSGDGAGGDIAINVDSLTLTGGAQIVTSSEGAGNGGRILITATEAVSVSGFDSEFTLSGLAPFGFVTSGVFSLASSSGNGGDITITAPTVAMDNGAILGAITFGDGRGGDVAINAGTVNLSSGAQIFSSGGLDFITTFEVVGTGSGGNITVTATEAVNISGMSPDVFTTSNISSFAFSSGTGGSVLVSAPDVHVEGGGNLSSISVGEGNGGNITVLATDVLSISGTDDFGNLSNIQSLAFASGNSGSVSISAGSVALDRGIIKTDAALGTGIAWDLTLEVEGDLSITGGGAIETLGGAGSAGNITINADTVSISGQFDSSTRSRIENINTLTGPSGDIVLSSRTLLLSSGARINNESFDQQTGNVSISATDSVTISGDSKIRMSAEDVAGGLLTISAPVIALDQGSLQTLTSGSGDAGAIMLSAGNLTLSRGSTVTSETKTEGGGSGGPIMVSASDSVFLSGGSTITSSTLASGQAGPLTVTAVNLVSLAGSGAGLLTETSGSGRGGDITAQGNQVQLADGATISAKSTGTGNAGNIQIAASDSLVMQNQSSITTATTQSDGGDIHIQAGHLVQLTGSTITTSVQGGLGNGGNITIDPEFVVLQGSQVIANAFGGNGGNISIVAGVFFADPTSTISASSTLGVSGTVDIQAPVKNLSGTLAPLPTDIVQAAALLQARCAARLAGGTSSSFVVAGRDGVPLEPGGPLMIPLFAESTGGPRPVGSLNLPGLRVGRTFGDPDLALTALNMGCAS